LLGHADSDAARLALYREIIKLCEEKLGSKGLAFTWCAKAYAIKPDDAALEKELERLGHAADAWEGLAELYAGEVEREKDEARKIARLRRLGQLALTRVHKPEDARRWFEALRQLKPDDEEALATLEQLFTQSQAFPELLGIYRAREEREK